MHNAHNIPHLDLTAGYASESRPVIFFPVDGCRIRKLVFEEGSGKKGEVRKREVECVST